MTTITTNSLIQEFNPKHEPPVSVCIPAYNKGNFIAETIDSVLNQTYKNYEIVIVDNASTDDTLKVAGDASKECPRVTVLHLDEKGKGRAIKSAMKDLGYDIYVFLDIDMSTDIKHIPELLRWVDEGYDVVIGSRLLPESDTERSLKREILSRG